MFYLDGQPKLLIELTIAQVHAVERQAAAAGMEISAYIGRMIDNSEWIINNTAPLASWEVDDEEDSPIMRQVMWINPDTVPKLYALGADDEREEQDPQVGPR